MVMKLHREAFAKLVDEDLAWLAKQPNTLERRHIEAIVKEAEYWHYIMYELLREAVSVTDAELQAAAIRGVVKGLIMRLEGPHGQ